MPALVVKNAVCSLGFIPRIVGNNSFIVDAVSMTAAFAVAYPFELARILIVH